MNIVISFQWFAFARYLRSPKRGMPTGVKEAKAKENRMTSGLQSVLKMRIRKIGANMEALVFMQSSWHKGFKMARKRVARLMQEQGLSARRRKKKTRTTNNNHAIPITSHLLKSNFTSQ